MPVLKNLVAPLLSHYAKESLRSWEEEDQFEEFKKISPLKETHLKNRGTHKAILIHIHDEDIPSPTQ